MAYVLQSTVDDTKYLATILDKSNTPIFIDDPIRSLTMSTISKINQVKELVDHPVKAYEV